jgi:hypothetical protein
MSIFNLIQLRFSFIWYKRFMSSITLLLSVARLLTQVIRGPVLVALFFGFSKVILTSFQYRFFQYLALLSV